LTKRRARSGPDAPRADPSGISWILGTIAAGVVASLVARPSAWHAALAMPPWTPPPWALTAASIATYLATGLAAALVWRERGKPGVMAALALYLAQLACNVLWSFLFFGMRQLDVAMLDLSLLWVLAALTARAFHRLRPLAGWLLAPYLAWITFRAALNLSIWLRN
jgi:benzodiazapine receptor